MLKYTILISTLLLSSCSLFSKKKLELKAHPNNTPVKQKLPSFVKIDLSAEGYIVMKQKFKSYGFCEAMKPDMEVDITPFKKFNKIKTTGRCYKKSKTFVLKSKNILPMGSYKVDLDFEHDNETMLSHPVVGVNYKDPDFASEDDHIRDGAASWAANQKMAAVINPGEGDKTDWLKIEPSGGTIQITLLDKSRKNNIIAHVYWVNPEKDKVTKKRYLKTNRRMTIPHPDGKDVFLRILGKDLVPETKYTLLRKDLAKVETKRLKVVDFIQMDESSWSALIKATDGITDGDKIKIKAQKANGKYITLGKCKVTSVDDSFINCSINTKGGDFINYYGLFTVKDK